MKGNISLGEFIDQVKAELVEAQNATGTPFFQLEGVDLEVTFALETTGGAKGRLVVVELGGEASASQTHKVTIKLTPVISRAGVDRGEPEKATASEPESRVGGGGGGFSKYAKPVYGPNKT